MNNNESLNSFKKLLDAGIISEDDYAKGKQKILNNIEANNAALNSPRNASSRLKTSFVNNKKRIVYLLSGLIVLFVIAFIANYEYRKQHAINDLKISQTFVKVYFDVEDVFPVHLFYLKNTKQGLMELTISNSALESKDLKVSYGFTGFGVLESQSITVAGGSVQKLAITPYSSKLMEVITAVNATLLVKVTDENKEVYSNSWSLKMHPCDELPWKIKNKDCTKLITSWVTPTNESIVELIGKAKVRLGGSIGQIDSMNDSEFNELVKAIFNTVRAEGITYINNTISFDEGFLQRVHFPAMALKTKSANSIDGSVLLASLFENVGLRPSIVILPGHVIVGVSRPNSKSNTLFIETTLLGRSAIESIFTFESTYTAATKMGRDEYSKAYSKSGTPESGMFSVIDVYRTRQEGVMPIGN